MDCRYSDNQLIQSDGFVSDSSWDIHERVWYQILAENSEESILSPVYQDATSDKMIVSVAMPYRNDAGEMIGIVGIDLSMDTLETYFGGISIGDTGHIAVFDSAHNLVYHPDSALLLSSLSDMPYSDNMKTLLQNQQSSDVIQYQEDGVDFYGGTVFMEEYDWSILATMPGSEYLRETTILSWILVIGFLGCIVVSCLICLARTRAIVKPLQAIGTVAREVANGRLDTEIRRNTNDEIGDLEEIFCHTQENLKAIISDIARVLQEIANKNITVDTSVTYQGAFHTIQDSLRSIIGALNTTMCQVREAASQIDAGSTQVSDGSQALAQGAAEQAGAVEAARAGVAGKGFAVVADEVRSLAAKSAEASQTTQDLIQKSIHAVDRGNVLAEDAAQVLAQTVSDASEVVNIITKIAAASEEQSDAISQVTKALDQISSVVQTNSATAEESAAASEELSNQASMLHTLIGTFRLKGERNQPQKPYRAAVAAAAAYGGADKY